MIDRATYDDPKQLSAGIDKVFVNGVLAYEAGSTSVKRAGRLVGGRAFSRRRAGLVGFAAA